ncbi:MAG: PmoA family protein [Verrucomicrobiota bacterium]
MKIPSFLVLSVLAAFSQAGAASFTVDKTPTGGAIVKLDGDFLTELVVDQANKTYLWPIIGTSGVTMTRAYPMKKVDGEQHDHPHHRGLCFGHESIAGYDTWAEAATFPKGAKNSERLDHLGAIKLREITEMKGGETATITTLSDYLDAAGKKTSEEVRKYTFAVKGATRVIDVDIDLIASEADIVVDDKKDAGLSIRVPTEMAVDRGKEAGGKGTGKIINSEGVTDEAAWGKRATWVDYHGTVGGKAVGVAMLNHPSSFRHPTPWHVRTYGLFTANPFGLSQLKAQEATGAMTLKKGEKLTLRHRFVFHDGDEKAGKIAEAYAEYAKEK